MIFNNLQGPKKSGARKLEDEEWFHGVLPRDEVQRLLKDNGDYLVRESKNKKTGQAQYVLSVMWMNDYKHFIIQGAEVSIQLLMLFLINDFFTL